MILRNPSNRSRLLLLALVIAGVVVFGLLLHFQGFDNAFGPWHVLIQVTFEAIFTLGTSYAILLDQAANWALYAALIFLFASSLPAWISDGIGSFFVRLAPIRESVAVQPDGGAAGKA